MATLVIVWFAVINVVTVLRFRQDKRSAVEGRRRIPEAKLLGLAMIGGSPGAFAARRMFRHKTRKEPFSTQLTLIAAIQLGVAAGLFLF